jgi:hypothetical protein
MEIPEMSVKNMKVHGTKKSGRMPLLKKRSVRDLREEFRLTRLAREYIIDFNLVNAAARADIAWNLARKAERNRFFIQITHELLEQMPHDKVITKQEILQGLKKEATGAMNATDRINAYKALAKLTGMETPQESNDNKAPIINLTLHT